MKGVLKVSREQVLEIEKFCNEKGVSKECYLDGLGISKSAFYYTRRKMVEEGTLLDGHFIPVVQEVSLQVQTSSKGKKSRKGQKEPVTIELRMRSGVEMRITGNFDSDMISTILRNV